MKQREDADQPPARLRLDKWLWAARFYKTRSLAAQAVEGGKVRLSGERVKPAKEVKTGDCLELCIGDYQWSIEVRAVSPRRGPATQAALLYVETEESRERREHLIAMRRVGPHPGQTRQGRPTKRDRRLIRRFTEE